MSAAGAARVWLLPLLVAGLSGCGSDEADPGSTSDAGTDAATDAGAEVGPPPGGPDSCPSGACNYQTQSGCATEQACRPAIDQAAGAALPSCSGVDGPGAAGSSCSSWDDCRRGTLCVSGTCRTLCCGGDWSACGEDEGCYGTLSVTAAGGGDVYPTGAGVCLPTGDCDVFDDTSCGAPDSACQIVDARGRVGCVPRGSAEPGQPCASTSDCNQGSVCSGVAGDRRCRSLCRSDGGAPGCGDGERCVHQIRHPPGVGECVADAP